MAERRATAPPAGFIEVIIALLRIVRVSKLRPMALPPDEATVVAPISRTIESAAAPPPLARLIRVNTASTFELGGFRKRSELPPAAAPNVGAKNPKESHDSLKR